jgi:glutamine cyclotransferase
MYGQSVVRQVDLQSGEVLQELPLTKRQFGEGLARIGHTLYSLTWRTGVIIKWEVEKGVLKKVGYLTSFMLNNVPFELRLIDSCL